MNHLEQNKSIVSELIESLFTKGDLEAVDRYLAPDFVDHDPPFGARAGLEGMRSAGAMFRTAFPDWHSDQHLLVAERDIVVEHFIASGTHRGEVMGVRPTGDNVSLKGINIFASVTDASSSDGVVSTISGSSLSSASCSCRDIAPAT
jgi:predicted ester cyclase